MQNVTRFNTTRNGTPPLITIIFVWREENSILFQMLPTLYHAPESPVNTTNPAPGYFDQQKQPPRGVASFFPLRFGVRLGTGAKNLGWKPGMEHHTRGLYGVLA